MKKQDILFKMMLDDDIYYDIYKYDVTDASEMDNLMEYFKPNFSKYGLSVEEVTYEDFVEAVKEAQTYIELEYEFHRRYYTHHDATDDQNIK